MKGNGQRHGAWGMELGAWGMELGARSLGYVAGSLKHRARDIGPGAKQLLMPEAVRESQ